MPASTFWRHLAGSIPGDILPEVEAEFRLGWEREAVQAEIEQRNVAEINSRLERAMLDGIGQTRLSISPAFYMYWVNRLGHGCWSDKQFLREIERDNPQARVQSRKKIQILRP
jgi:hypothetical protein